MNRGNQRNFVNNPIVAQKTINREDRYSHLLPLAEWCCLFSPYLRHNSEGIVIKAGKKSRVVWDGSTKRTPMDNVMNKITTMLGEADISFDQTKQLFYEYLYNLGVSFTHAIIYLATADKKACFPFPCIHPDLTRVF